MSGFRSPDLEYVLSDREIPKLGSLVGEVCMASKKSARVVCAVGSFWVTPKVFWNWVREGLVEMEGERPLSGSYKGQFSDFQVSVNHVILDAACPEHLQEVIRTQRRRRACA